uniref:STARP-like antigen n=1 Tax=Echinococcus granulosus TaxID=6210 RepID=A0A068X4N0_ECHGR|nr:STARP-like antigen [Echinococcus granulosus]
MFQAPVVKVVSAPSVVSTHSSTYIQRTEGRGVLSRTSSRQRFESRRVKKQNMERVRRARISDKIAQLHGLALSMVGKDVEMLGFCHDVLSSLRNLLVESPDMMERLKAYHRGDTVTSAVCQNITPDSPTTSQIGYCDSGVYVSPTSVTHSSSVEGNGADRTEYRLPPKKRQEVWRPYL